MNDSNVRGFITERVITLQKCKCIGILQLCMLDKLLIVTGQCHVIAQITTNRLQYTRLSDVLDKPN